MLCSCSKLEEVIVDCNVIQELPSLHILTHLTHLSVPDNKLTSLPSLLPQLEHLNISYNQISTLDPLKVFNLMHLYTY